MYQKPDFLTVSVKVKDVFSSYLASGCPHDEYTSYTSPCSTADENYVHMDYLELGWGDGCYSIHNP